MTDHEHRREPDRDPLTAALRALAAEEETNGGASKDVEARLLAEVRAIAWARRRRRYVMTTLASAAALVVAAAAAFALWQIVGAPQTPRDPRATTNAGASIDGGRTPGPGTAGNGGTTASPTANAVSTGEIATAFIPLAYSSIPASEQYLVRMEVPRAALASFGLSAIESTAVPKSTGTVVADVLVGQDGLARAIRFVRPSINRDQSTSREQPHPEQKR